jgi:lysozyme family protein
MTPTSIEQTVDEILDHREGSGFTDRASDKGGPTKWGVTLKTLSAYLGRQATVDELKVLTREQALNLYLKLFVFEPGFQRISSDMIGEFVIDLAVNHGVPGGVKLLQSTLGAKRDGIFGPQTLALTNLALPRVLLEKLIVTRAHYYVALALAEVPRELIERTDLDNLDGWLARDLSFISKL